VGLFVFRKGDAEMYYFVNDEDGRIVESTWGGDPELTAQQLANECQCGVYVIRGEHTGIEVKPITAVLIVATIGMLAAKIHPHAQGRIPSR
jgi:hypothetical protein